MNPLPAEHQDQKRKCIGGDSKGLKEIIREDGAGTAREIGRRCRA